MNAELNAELEKLQSDSSKELKKLQIQYEEITSRYIQNRLDLIEGAGYSPCPKCSAFGKVGRLDGSYMRRFGLRDWNGCENCGGEGEISGCGYVKN